VSSRAPARGDRGLPAAIVTGSDSGIGRATAIALANDGFDVGITWHTDEDGAAETAALVRETGNDAHVCRLDLACPSEAPRVVDELTQALGRLDAHVNNAAVDHRAELLDETLGSWMHVLAVNLTGAFVCAQAATRHMIRQGEGGRIVNVTSIHEHAPTRGGAAYCAAKGGLGLLTKVMALELAQHAITVNSIAPGHIATPMTTGSAAEAKPGRRVGVPIGRIGQPAEVAALIAHLCSASASYTTGSSFAVDGGLLLMAVECLEPPERG